MIKTAQQLKDKIRNLAKGNSAEAQYLMRNFMMERFLERIAQSNYKEYFILKGGVLIASLVGFNLRSTMDIDATINGLTIHLPEIEKMIQEVIAIPLEDGVRFQIENINPIRKEAEYPGIRVGLQAFFDGTVTTLKVDVTAGDILTPSARIYPYKLMFEDRYIQILSYNLETLLAEKMETIISRHVTNTRMRDFYDIYILNKLFVEEISKEILQQAIEATARRRGSADHLKLAKTALLEIEANEDMQGRWRAYQAHFLFARDIEWLDVMETVYALALTAAGIL